MSKHKDIDIIDYGLSNIFSVSNAVTKLGYKANITSSSETILNSNCLILPGVGYFSEGIERIINLNLYDAIKHAVNIKKTPILGICLGMQLLSNSSTEGTFNKGLGLIDCEVDLFGSTKSNFNLKLPHIGFSSIEENQNSILLRNIPNNCLDFYFVHTYRIMHMQSDVICSYSNYGEKFVSLFENKNVFGTQFHPEKSQSNGLLLLKNFLSYCHD